jgi:hypothetical protein
MNKEREEFLKLNPHYVVTYHIYKFRDLSGNDINIPPLEDGEYLQFMQDVNAAVRVGPLIISIYTDASGINAAMSSDGNPIIDRFLKTTSYTYPYIDASGNYKQGIMTCIFGNDSTFSNDDANNSAYWYNIKGISDPNNLQQYT